MQTQSGMNVKIGYEVIVQECLDKLPYITSTGIGANTMKGGTIATENEYNRINDGEG